MGSPRRRILIVDDEGIIALDLQHKLRNMGYDVPAIVHSAEQAIAKVEALRPDLVLMDIRLEGSAMDGVEAAERIRDQFGTAVVFVTAFADEPTIARAKLTGPYGYVVKPFTESAVRIAVEIGIHTSQAVALLRRQARQQAAVAGFSQHALRETDVEALLQTTVECVVHALELTSCVLLEASGESATLSFRASAGRPFNGSPAVKDALEAQARFALASTTPVVVEDFAREPRFDVVALQQPGLTSGMSCLIGDAAGPLGVLSAFGSGGRIVNQEDVSFLQVVANVVYQAYERRRAEQSLRRAREDIADRERAAAERLELLRREQEARREAEAANRAKDEFLAVVSHELRTPLNVIMGWASLLGSGKLDAAMAADAVITIERNSKVQARMIEDILDVSRIITGKLYTEFRVIHLANVVTAALEEVRPEAGAHQVRVETRIEAGEDLIWADANRLHQVVGNLLSNAIKFTPPDGVVTVTLIPRGTSVVLEVRDSGQGISAEFLPHVFERFRQADSSNTRSHGGLGLGLAIVRHLVELHGGVITATSGGAGAGAAFTITLPLVKVHQEAVPGSGQGPEELSLAPPAADGLRVLVVDDEVDTRQLFVRMLELAGARVGAAASTATALQSLRHEWPDVLVVDVAMPGDDGLALLHQVRLLEGGQSFHLPAVAVSASARAQDHEAALAAGFQCHLIKPVAPEVLVSTVAELGRQPVQVEP